MTVTIDDVEYKAWHFGAEPLPERMSELLDAVRKFAEGSAPQERPASGRGMKTCSRCKKEKNRQDGFNKDRSTKDGLRYQCRECESEMRRRLRSAAAARKTDKYGNSKRAAAAA
jgi:hypothetical protein